MRFLQLYYTLVIHILKGKLSVNSQFFYEGIQSVTILTYSAATASIDIFIHTIEYVHKAPQTNNPTLPDNPI